MPRRSFSSYQRRAARKAHGCEPPFSQRYGEAITSTTKGRGAVTKGLNPAFRIHLEMDVSIVGSVPPNPFNQ